MLFGILVVLYVFVCIVLCLLVLIQSDKGGGISATLGGGFAGANALLGTQDTANILTRGTTLFASLYVGLCIILTIIVSLSTGRVETKSIMKERAERTPASILDNAALPMAGEQPGGAQSPGMPQVPAEQQGGAAQGANPIPLGQAPAPSGGK